MSSCDALRERVPHRRAVDGLDVLAAQARRSRRGHPAAQLAGESGAGAGVWSVQRSQYERPLAGPRTDQLLALEVAVSLQHGVRVDRELRDHLAGGGQLIARPQHSQPERLPNLVDQLEVSGYARSGVELKLEHWGHPFTNQLVKGCHRGDGRATPCPARYESRRRVSASATTWCWPLRIPVMTPCRPRAAAASLVMGHGTHLHGGQRRSRASTASSPRRRSCGWPTPQSSPLREPGTA